MLGNIGKLLGDIGKNDKAMKKTLADMGKEIGGDPEMKKMIKAILKSQEDQNKLVQAMMKAAEKKK